MTGDVGLGDAGVSLGDAGVGLGDSGVASNAATCSIKAFCDAGAAEEEAFLKAGGVVAGGGDVVAFFEAGLTLEMPSMR